MIIIIILNYFKPAFNNCTKMMFSHEILTNLPREEVIDKMEDPAGLKHWQRSFIYSRHLSGLQGKEGAKYKLKYSTGKKDIILIKSILKRVYPKKIHCTFETEGIFKIWKNFFEEAPGNKTRWIVDKEIQFSGLGKFVGIFKADTFKKHTLELMQEFKAYSEEGKSVLDQ